jgi:putative oxidoreductase
MINKLDDISILIGRSLLGLYFLGPGLAKIFNYSSYAVVMEENQVPLTLIALPVVILIQVIGGIMLILNLNVKVSALALFITTIAINIYIHDFWTLAEGISKAHETQNFVKNLAICAGLLVLASREKFVKLG